MKNIRSPQNRADRADLDCSLLHLRFGWWSLLAFLTLGFMLESLHALKVGWYLSVANETRRLMWTLAHAHGTLLALVNVAFGLTIQLRPSGGRRYYRASRFLLAASLLLPMGFFLGGIFVYGGDPGLGSLLVPVGSISLFIAVYLIARSAGSQTAQPVSEEGLATKETLRSKSRR
jgi:hypothetical protein